MQPLLFKDYSEGVATRHIESYFDGACEPYNPGGAMGYGAVVYIDKKPVYGYAGFQPAGRENSNNIAEYLALELLLDYLLANKLALEHVFIKGDSKLVIKQMKGEWSVKNGFYVPYAERCLKKLSFFNRELLHLLWIPREENEIADKLSKNVLLQHKIVISERLRNPRAPSVK